MHKNILIVVGITILFLGTCITPSVAIDNVKKTSIPNRYGNILYVGGTGEGNYTKIQDAIDNASDGDTVFVYAYSSPYYEHIVIGGHTSINLIGEDKNTTVIDGSGSGDVVYVTTKWINISGFTIRNCGGKWDDAGIEIDSDNNTIMGNNICSNSWGILIEYCENNIVTSNNIQNNTEGIYLYFAYHNTVTENTISNNNNGIHLWKSYNNIITYNNILNNYEDGVFIYRSTDNIIKDNIISKNNKGVYLLFHYKYNTITGNNIFNNEWGICIHDSCNYNTITSNNITFNNFLGIALHWDSSNNIIYHNNFIKRYVFDECNNTWDDGYPSGGNFWDKYDGTDSNGDGIGDIPYPIPGGNNEDRYPLMAPLGNQPPTAPQIDGPTSGKAGEPLTYTFTSTDPEGDDISYLVRWDWACGGSETSDFVPSGEPVSMSHTYNSKGTYSLRVMAKDINQAESNWSEFEVTIPRTKTTSNILILRLFERFPNAFPLLRQLLGFL